jgi:hypothetical protein
MVLVLLELRHVEQTSIRIKRISGDLAVLEDVMIVVLVVAITLPDVRMRPRRPRHAPGGATPLAPPGRASMVHTQAANCARGRPIALGRPTVAVHVRVDII